MSTERYSAVVIGCGRIGSLWSEQARVPGLHSHAQAYADHPRTALAAVVDVDPAAAERAGKHWNVDFGTDAIDLCSKTRPDIVSICAPDDAHAAIAQALIEHAPPRLLFIEKPLATRVEDAACLLKMAEAKGVAISVNYSRRFDSRYRRIRAELLDGKLGTPVFARAIYGKGLLHNGTHAIDLLRFWFGEPSHVKRGRSTWGPRGDCSVSFELTFENGCRADVQAFDERVASVFEMDVFTDRFGWRFWNGGEQWMFFERLPAVSGHQHYQQTHREQTDSLFQQRDDSLPNAVSNLVGFLDGHEALICTGEDALGSLKCAMAIRQEARA